MKSDEPRGWRGKKDPPTKKQGHTAAERLKHLEHRADKFDELLERIAKDILELTMNAQDLAAAIAALRATVDSFPPPAAQLITQPELDAAVQGVTDANAALIAKTPPTP